MWFIKFFLYLKNS